MTERKLSADHLRKIVFAEMNVSAYRTKVYEDLLAEIDGRSTEKEDVKGTTTAKKVETKKTTKVKEVVEEIAEESEADDDMFGDDDAKDEDPTLDDVRKIVKTFATKHGKEKALKLLGKFKASAIPDVKKQDYAKIIELAKKHL